MIISVASGKGGTGKTLVATSLALALKKSNIVQILDCDVEEPNDQLLLRPELTGSKKVSIPVPLVDETKCNQCGICTKVCVYHAIAVLGKTVLVFPQLCHGCGACSYLCPEKAIREENREMGIVEWGHSDGLKFVHGKLTVGQAMSPPVIRQVKALADNNNIVIIDVPPGTSCPVVEAVKHSDFCLLVTEPTPFGLNDLVLAVGMVRALDIPFGIVLNRAGIGDTKVEEYCLKENIPLLLTIPLDMEIAKKYSRGITLVEGFPEWKAAFIELYSKLKDIVNERDCRIKR